MVRRVPRLLSREWPPSTPMRLAVLFMLKAFMMSVEHRGGGGSRTARQAEKMQKNNATVTAGGEHEDFWVFLTHPVDHVYLLQRLSDGVFVLGVAGNIG